VQASSSFNLYLPLMRSATQGQRIVATSTRDVHNIWSPSDIAIINADGSNLVYLTNHQSLDEYNTEPVWSPDGTRIAFASAFYDPLEDKYAQALYIMNADGTQRFQLTPPTLRAWLPSWSPDGRTIIFTGSLYGCGVDTFPCNEGIYRIDPEGTDVRLLYPNGSRAAWSPDGTQIALMDAQPSDYPYLAIMRSDGTNLRRLIISLNPSIAWSPDGTLLAITGESDGALCLVPVDGTKSWCIADKNTLDGHRAGDVVWSADGQQLLFTIDSGSIAEPTYLAVIRRDGTGLRTFGPPGLREPAWQP
jgi:Tol biopolymer transport system component